jgi:RNA 2',3'-cyclic 3'-phosphodiesterase
MDRRTGRAGGALTGPPGALRLFVAVPLPEAAVSAVIGRIEAVGEAGRARGIRWVQAEGLHLTIRFLGAAPAEAVAPVVAALEEVAASTPPFDIVLEGAGAFPSASRPRVLWLGIGAGAAELTQLAQALERPLELAGWPVPDRPFRPHMTVARTDAAPYDAASAAAHALIEGADGSATRFAADRIVLFRSHLGRGPARYQSLAEVPLRG